MKVIRISVDICTTDVETTDEEQIFKDFASALYDNDAVMNYNFELQQPIQVFDSDDLV